MTTQNDPKKIEKQSQKNISKKTKNRKHDWSFYVIIACLVIIAIPSTFIGFKILKARMEQGKPLYGDRFINDLNPAIEQSTANELAKMFDGDANIDDVEVTLQAATLRVMVQTKPDASEELVSEYVTKAYDNVVASLPVDTYFTAHDGRKQYDLEVSAYNIDKIDDTNRDQLIFVQIVKNSNMEKESLQILSKARDPKLVEELKAAQAASEAQDEKDASSSNKGE